MDLEISELPKIYTKMCLILTKIQKILLDGDDPYKTKSQVFLPHEDLQLHILFKNA